MTDRESRIDRFLAAAGWSDAERLPMTGDLSARRYWRLARPGATSAILMDAPPEMDASTPAFVQMTDWLHSAGLSAPKILAGDPETGLLLLEDLGDDKVSDIASNSTRHAEIYDLCLDLLVHIRRQHNPPLSQPDASSLVDMTTLADQFYPGVVSSRLTSFRTVLETVLADLLSEESTVSLRDFHADNLMWLPRRKGIARLGLLDYQDAFLTHPVYDLVSLLTDARTDIKPQFRSDMIALYATRAGDDPVRLNRAFAAFSAQRNLRILGIFARAARQYGKPHHLPKLPRVHAYLSEALRHPVFADVAEETLAAIPAPTPDLIASLR